MVLYFWTIAYLRNRGDRVWFDLFHDRLATPKRTNLEHRSRLDHCFRYAISFGMSSVPRCKMPRLPSLHVFSENFWTLSPSILFPDMSRGTGSSL